MITTESIHRILIAMGVHPETAWLFAPHLFDAATKWEVSVAALPMFLAQTAHESMLFERMVESLNYTKAAQIRRTWPKRFANNSAAVAFVRKPERLANFVYANRLGNGDAASGDGWTYRGRGLIQITGRSNYALVQELTGLQVLDDPDLLCEPGPALLSALAWWGESVPDAESLSVEQVTRRVNGGTNGLDDRRRLFERALRVLEDA